jgi:branched-subunit amino acid aminotransferase/4-amino-4-deoxychorismate lyase
MAFVERAEIDGRPASAEDLRRIALFNYGHFTTLQVRDGRVRGLNLHVQRLEQASLQLFGQGLDESSVRQAMRQILLDTPDATLRINVFCRDSAAVLRGESVAPVVMVTLRAPNETAATPLRVRTFRYEREPAQLKHVGTLGPLYFMRQARRDGFDDALFVHANAGISEGSIWNIGFYDAHGVVWPDAPALPGITQQLLEAGLRQAGVPQSSRRIEPGRFEGLRGAFALNSSTIARPIAQIDDGGLEIDPAWLERLRQCYQGQPPEPI